jgi:isopenicillin N synthase-like dioxygenase
MSSLTEFTDIPVVDVAGLRGDPHDQERVARQLGAAARDVGFLYVTGTGIDPTLLDELLRVTKAFFDLPLDEKMRTYIGRSRNHRGYVPVGEEVFSGGTVDLKEAFDLGKDLPADDPDHLAGCSGRTSGRPCRASPPPAPPGSRPS